MTPLINADQTFALAAAIMVIVAGGLWAETRAWGQRLGGPLVLLAASMTLANIGVIPHAAPLYGFVAGFLVPLAIPLLLMRADFKAIVSESGPMLLAFLVAAGATFIGALIGVMVVDMGPFEAQIAGTVTASYIGGSLNFVAVAQAVGIEDSSVYVAALAADAVGAVLFLIALMMLPAVRFVRGVLPSKFIGVESGTGTGTDAGPVRQESRPFNLPGAACALAVSLVICAASAGLTQLFNFESTLILVVTALALLVANFAKPVVRFASSDFELGTLFMYIFFVVIGAGADLGEVLGAALPILTFIIVMVVVHFCVLLTVGGFLKLDLAEVMIASNACILGPPTAAALAASRGWQSLVAPGILVGMFGYAIATFIGVALAAFLG